MKKLQLTTVWIFLFLLPTQLGKHFFMDFSYIDGVRIDYLAPVLYLTDLVFLGLLFFQRKNVLKFLKKHQTSVGLVGLVFATHIILSAKPFIALYTVIKFIEVCLIAVIMSRWRISKMTILSALSAGAVVQLVLTLMQFSAKASLQGVFYYLGERYLTLSTPGIAKASFFGEHILRPYGTFSHPNSLGGFYALIFAFILTLKPSSNRESYMKSVLLLVSTMLVLISFSKAAIVATAFVALVHLFVSKNFFKNFSISCWPCILTRIIIGCIVVGIFLSTQGDVFTVQKRLLLLTQAFDIVKGHFLLGTGFGNHLYLHAEFPSPYPYVFIQPVHNIFVLFFMQAGLLLSAVLVYIGHTYRRHLVRLGKRATLPLLVVFLTGMVDHYWLTLQQNMLLLGVIFGVSLQISERQSRSEL